MSTLRIKTGDEVIVTTGAHKRKRGKIIQTFPAFHRVVVEGVNMRKRHLKTRKRGEKGQVIEFAMPIHASNVQLVVGDKPVRLEKRARTST